MSNRNLQTPFGRKLAFAMASIHHELKTPEIDRETMIGELSHRGFTEQDYIDFFAIQYDKQRVEEDLRETTFV